MVQKMFSVTRFEQFSQESGREGNTSSFRSNQTTVEPASNPTNLDEAERSFKIVFYSTLFILGTLGNVLVIVVVKGKLKRTINDYFILNLAAADLTFLWCSVPFYTYDLFKTFAKNLFYCKFVWPLMSVTLSASVFTLASMSVERCRGITNPFQPRIMLKTTLIWILLIWIVAFATLAPLMVVAKSGDVQCAEDWPHISLRKTYTAVLFGVQYVIPLVIITTAYLRIAFYLMTSRLGMRTSMNSRGQIVRQKTRTENLQIIRTLAVIVFLFMACMLPNQIAWLLFDVAGESYKDLSNAFWTCAEALIFLHACVNPVVYGTLTHQFRKGYVRYAAFMLCCRKTRLEPTATTQNVTKEQRNRNKQGHAIERHGSLQQRSSAFEKGRTLSIEVQSSTDLLASARNTYWGNRSTVLSPSAKYSSNIEMLARSTSTEQTEDSNAFPKFSFCNKSFDVSNYDKNNVEDTKL